MVAGTDTETRLAETNPNPGEKGPDGKIDYDKFVFAETNDHFLARWGDSPDFGLVAGVRPVGGAGVGIELVHFRLQGSDELTYAGRSFVGGQNYGDEAALNLSSSGTPSVRLQALGAGTRLTIEMNVFGPTDLGTGTPSELRVITAKTPAIDGQSNSTRRVVSPLLEKAGWNYAMPTGVILPGLPSLSKYWLVTYRGFKTKSEDPDDYGDVYRTWFTEEFRRTGTLVRELVSDNTGLCNRPHTTVWRGYVLTIWEQRSSQSQQAGVQYLLAEKIG
jgi:hypothetical protein